MILHTSYLHMGCLVSLFCLFFQAWEKIILWCAQSNRTQTASSYYRMASGFSKKLSSEVWCGWFMIRRWELLGSAALGHSVHYGGSGHEREE